VKGFVFFFFFSFSQHFKQLVSTLLMGKVTDWHTLLNDETLLVCYPKHYTRFHPACAGSPPAPPRLLTRFSEEGSRFTTTGTTGLA
jgi:hypothetical protein